MKRVSYHEVLGSCQRASKDEVDNEVEIVPDFQYSKISVWETKKIGNYNSVD